MKWYFRTLPAFCFYVSHTYMHPSIHPYIHASIHTCIKTCIHKWRACVCVCVCVSFYFPPTFVLVFPSCSFCFFFCFLSVFLNSNARRRRTWVPSRRSRAASTRSTARASSPSGPSTASASWKSWVEWLCSGCIYRLSKVVMAFSRVHIPPLESLINSFILGCIYTTAQKVLILTLTWPLASWKSWVEYLFLGCIYIPPLKRSRVYMPPQQVFMM